MTTNHALSPGTQFIIGDTTYTIERTLGSGGFGITYLATYPMEVGERTVRHSVAIKEHFLSADCERTAEGTVSCSQPARSRVDSSRKDFLSEARRLRTVGKGHQNIVKVDEVFEANNTAYYLMEYLEGMSLAQQVKFTGAPLSPAQTLSLMTPIIDAVAYLHRNRVTHLDIKPANIIISGVEDAYARPVLIDFGLSKHYNNDGSPTSTINTLGFSDGYAPAEQYLGIRTFSPSADVYALGATMLYCLSGKTPPKATDLNPKYIDSVLPAGTPDSMRRAIHAALQLRASDRPADAGELLKILNGTTVNEDKGPNTEIIDTNSTEMISTAAAYPKWAQWVMIAILAISALSNVYSIYILEDIIFPNSKAAVNFSISLFVGYALTACITIKFPKLSILGVASLYIFVYGTLSFLLITTGWALVMIFLGKGGYCLKPGSCSVPKWTQWTMGALLVVYTLMNAPLGFSFEVTYFVAIIAAIGIVVTVWWPHLCFLPTSALYSYCLYFNTDSLFIVGIFIVPLLLSILMLCKSVRRGEVRR